MPTPVLRNVSVFLLLAVFLGSAAGCYRSPHSVAIGPGTTSLAMGYESPKVKKSRRCTFNLFGMFPFGDTSMSNTAAPLIDGSNGEIALVTVDVKSTFVGVGFIQCTELTAWFANPHVSRSAGVPSASVAAPPAASPKSPAPAAAPAPARRAAAAPPTAPPKPLAVESAVSFADAASLGGSLAKVSAWVGKPVKLVSKDGTSTLGVLSGVRGTTFMIMDSSGDTKSIDALGIIRMEQIK